MLLYFSMLLYLLCMYMLAMYVHATVLQQCCGYCLDNEDLTIPKATMYGILKNSIYYQMKLLIFVLL